MKHPAAEARKAPQELAKIQVNLFSDPTVNYASHQNNVPLIGGLTLTNTTDEPLRDIEVTVHCEPAFAEPMRLRFERLDAREVRRSMRLI